MFGEVVSRKSSRRALTSLECLARLVELAGGRLSEPFKFMLLGETVKLEIFEETRQVQHEITKKEAKELEEYKSSSWHKPNIRKWGYEFTGVLKFKVDAGYDFPLQESLTAINRGLSQKSIPDLSELLSKVFLVMCKVCIATHKERIGVEASLEDYERGIEKQRQQIELYNDEIDRLFEIKEEAARYQEAQTLRDYAAAIEKTGNDGSQGKA